MVTLPEYVVQKKRKMYFTNELPPPPVELIYWSQFGLGDMDMDVGLGETTNKDKNDKIGKGNAEIICTGLGEGLLFFLKGLELLFQCCALAQ